MTARTFSKTTFINSDHVVIGHDILSLISSAMYVEPETIYRELVQNAADAIDDAIEAGVLAREEGYVQISIDELHRQIIVRDNGIGISNADFAKTMCAIGASQKRGTKARGFRGIGRLVGLGYAQELSFRSRSHGRERVFEAKWDARLLKELLQSRQRAALTDAIAAVVQVTERTANADDPEHFFEVELRKVIRLPNDDLLNARGIERYLSEVAPVPFHDDFKHGPKIVKEISSVGPFPTLDIRVNGSSTPLRRPYRNQFVLTPSKTVTITDYEPFRIPAYDSNETAAIAWIGKHEYLGAFPKSLGVRGLRARVGNLQIGNERIFAEAFKEERFADWAIGEVHVFDERIMPNGRRDGFEPSLHLSNLMAHLSTKGREIARVARSSSIERRMDRGIVSVEAALTEYIKLLKRSPEAYVLRDELLADVRAEMEKTRRRVVASDRKRWDAKITHVEDEIEKVAATKSKNHGRATQREMGRVDVLRALREEIPGGLGIATSLLKILSKGR